MNEIVHRPALLKATLELMQPREGETFVDFTLGGAGHFAAFLPYLGAEGLAIGLDRDDEAIARAKRLQKDWPTCRIVLRQAKFSEAESVLQELGVEGINLALFDLGVSAFQVDDPTRGFSYLADGPLSMQMGSDKKKAMELVNGLGEKQLTQIISTLGEERYAKRIAKSIVRKREEAPINTTLELVSAVDRAIPPRRSAISTPSGRACSSPSASSPMTKWTSYIAGCWGPSDTCLRAGGWALSPGSRWKTARQSTPSSFTGRRARKSRSGSCSPKRCVHVVGGRTAFA